MGERSVVIRCDGARLGGELVVPAAARGLVILAGLGEVATTAPDARALATQLVARAEVGTLLLDLLSAAEASAAPDAAWMRAHVPLLAQRMSAATDWALLDAEMGHLHVGYFARGAGAAAALHASTSRPEVHAIVSRGGRPDLAGPALDAVRAPTLLLVGDDDDELLAANRSARARLRAASELAVLPRGEVPSDDDSVVDDVVRRASAWFARYIA